jgi:DNA-binding cell septation regulator SpoVG
VVAVSAPIEVLEVRRIIGEGNLRAFAAVRLGAVVIRGCRIVQQPGQKAWVSLPQQKSGDRYYPVVEITRKELLDQVREAILEAWERAP